MVDTDWHTRIDRLWTVIGRCYPIAYLYCHVLASRKTSRERRESAQIPSVGPAAGEFRDGERRCSPAGFGRLSNGGTGVSSGHRSRVHRRDRRERDAETKGGARLEVEPGSGADADR